MATITNEVRQKTAADVQVIAGTELPRIQSMGSSSGSVASSSTVDSNNEQFEKDVRTQNKHWLLVGGEDSQNSFKMAERLVDSLLDREKEKLPEARLAAIEAACDQFATLVINDEDIMNTHPNVQDEPILANLYNKEIYNDPGFMDAIIYKGSSNQEFMNKLKLIYLEGKKLDIKNTYRDLLLTGISAELAAATDLTVRSGVIPKLRASIETATKRFTAINQNTFQVETDKKKRLTVVQSAISGISDLHITDADEAIHYEVLLRGFAAKLGVSTEAATKRFTDVNKNIFQAKTDRPNRLIAVQAAINGISDLHIADADEAAHYEALLREFTAKLNASIEAATKRFTAINQNTFQTEVDKPKKLVAVEAAINGLNELHIADADEAAHYEALLREFAAKLNASIGTAIKRFTEINQNNFQKITSIPDRLKAVAEAIKGINDLHLNSDEAAHYASLLQGYIDKLRVSIAAAESLFNAKIEAIDKASSEDPMLTISGIKEAMANISSIVAEEDTRRHYYNLLEDRCHQLEDKLGIARTRFKEFGFDEEKSLFKRYAMMKRAQSMLFGYSTAAVASSSAASSSSVTGSSVPSMASSSSSVVIGSSESSTASSQGGGGVSATIFKKEI